MSRTLDHRYRPSLFVVRKWEVDSNSAIESVVNEIRRKRMLRDNYKKALEKNRDEAFQIAIRAGHALSSLHSTRIVNLMQEAGIAYIENPKIEKELEGHYQELFTLREKMMRKLMKIKEKERMEILKKEYVQILITKVRRRKAAEKAAREREEERRNLPSIEQVQKLLMDKLEEEDDNGAMDESL